jgi:parallel beta-helix repeat protein
VADAHEGVADPSGGGPSTVHPAEVEIRVDEALRLAALDEAGRSVEVSWSSSGPSVAAVDPHGVVRGVAPGTATITARSRSRSVEAKVLVSPALPAAIPSGTRIEPGEDIQARVDAHPEGTTFTLAAGTHRLQQVTPKNGNTFVGEVGAVLSGARLLTTFAREGSYWVAVGQTQRGQVHGSCARGHPRCNRPEDLFIDDVALRHVETLAEVGPGTWHFDYDAGRIYFADDHSGRTVETSVTRHAFVGGGRHVTIRGLTIEKYANPAQNGAIHGNGTTGWVIENNVVRLNHGVGLRIGHEMVVRGNQFLSNGQLGVGGIGDNTLVENNEIAHNNTAGFNWEWEGGGSKWVRTRNLVVRGNYAHHNHGPGLWTDINNIHTLYEGNLVEDNHAAGIFHEISYDAVIRNNTVRRNGWGKSVWLWGAGILVAASPNVEVYGNTVEENADGIAAIQQNRGSGMHGPYLVENLHVHGNTITMVSGQTGLAQDVGDLSLYTDRNNRFENNTYHLGTRSLYFEWMGRAVTERDWRGFGNDSDGSFNRM